VRRTLPFLLVLAAGCSGGPLKELPAFEPPPVEAPAQVEATAREPRLPTLVGAWVSVAALGPGSASIRRVVIVFDEDGDFTAAAFGTSSNSTLAGAYREMDGAVEVDLGDDGLRVWPAELGVDTLVLHEGDREIRLKRMP
jgi:hypothetical protein